MTGEGPVVSACLDYLAARGIMAWRNNSGAVKLTRRDGKEGFVRFGKKGSADIIGVLPGGRFIAVECKTEKGRLSGEQTVFLENVKKAGGVAFVARSAYDVEKALKENGI
jgi:hypothetical protein